MRIIRTAILGSTRGTNMLALIDAIQQKRLPASLEVVISNRPDALILERAKMHNIPAYFIDPQHCSREEYDARLNAQLVAHQIELVVLIGYMRILSAGFVAAWHNKIINVHPSLLPAFAGGMDKAVHQAVLDARMQESGCTVHYVTEQVDQGPILVQKKCKLMPEDTVDSLKNRVQALEGEALIEAIKGIADCSNI